MIEEKLEDSEITKKELYRYWLHHPVKTVKLFLKGMKRAYQKEFKE